jgi:crotonobetainyl-CoA:carnitine CoA-transferase CaiB-like acyl-CoA transferase
MPNELPLRGVRVLDLSRLLPGPFCTMVLGDLGADVVKVEDPRGGDYLRWMPPSYVAQSGLFHAVNRNKRSMRLDLKAPGATEALLRLVGRFDVVVESFRPGVMDKLGVGYGRLREANPGVILCSISGFGQDGPYRDRPGHDLNYCAIAGVLSLNGPREKPLPLGVQVADVAGGAFTSAVGILAALVRRGITGEGAQVDISMTEGALSMLAMTLGGALARGTPLTRGREMLSGGASCYTTYRTRDGRFVALGALEPKFFKEFCEAVGRPELAERQFDGEGDGPRAELEAIFAGRTRDEWAALAQEKELMLTPVLEGDEPRRDPQLVARGAFVEVETPWEGGKKIVEIANPVRFKGVKPRLEPAPEMGAHTDAVLGEAGLSAAEIAKLKEAGAC